MKRVLKYWWVLLVLTPIIVISSMIISVKSAENSRKKSLEYAEKLVLQPDGNYSIDLLEDIKKRLSFVPSEYLKVLYDKQVFIRAINGPITDAPEFTTVKELKENKANFEKFDGVFILNSILISTNERYFPGLEVHEVGHAVDFIVFKDISNSQEFKDIFNKEGTKYFNKPTDEHNVSNNMEYFAQAFHNFYYSAETRKDLKARAPETYKFIKKLESKK